jgi:hypothetical protein
MSSFGKKLAAEFEAEFARLANGWYLKWHALARGESIELDDFHGGMLRPPSRTFDAAAEHVYWGATRRYIASKIEETFARIEWKIGLQTGDRAARTAEESAIALRTFLEKLHRHAVFTEYRLQARGYPDERYLAARRDDTIVADVQRRKMLLLEKHRAMSWLDRISLAFAGSRMPRLAWLGVAATALVGGAVVVFRYIPAML